MLVTTLEKYLNRDPLKASRGMYISPEIVVVVGLHFFAGEPYTALNDIANISTTSVYRLKNRFIQAVLEAEELKIKFPQTAEEWEEIRVRFENISSSHKLFHGCVVGAIDGYFAVTQQPYVKDCNVNPMAYMSGHYGMFGLNCQGLCDAREQ
jgi:predicted membrane channel-forming protein YqfA (hemolysin III family)